MATQKDTPLFFLAFANNFDKPLPNLKLESEHIYNILTPVSVTKQIEIHRDDFSTTNSITYQLVHRGNQMSLFHYAGHADENELFFGDQNANASGLAHLLAQQSPLQLVILNGCSTFDHVQLLLELGIPAVIATSSSIDDQLASEFSITFYTALTQQQTIGKAFKQAAAHIRMKTDNMVFPRNYRDVKSRNTGIQKLSWGIYTNSDEILNHYLIPAIKKIENKSKNTISNSTISAGGNINVGDVITGGVVIKDVNQGSINIGQVGDINYNFPTPPPTLGQNEKSKKENFSKIQLQILKETHIEGTLQEENMINLIHSLTPKELQSVQQLYKRVLNTSWREVQNRYNEIEEYLSAKEENIHYIKKLLYHARTIKPLNQKIRLVLPIIPIMMKTLDSSQKNSITSIWEDL